MEAGKYTLQLSSLTVWWRQNCIAWVQQSISTRFSYQCQKIFWRYAVICNAPTPNNPCTGYRSGQLSIVRWRGSATGRALDLRSTGCGFKSYSGQKLRNNLEQVFHSHLCASVTKQYNLVPAKGQWCSAAGKVTAGLAESNGSLPPGGWLIVTCGLTACTPGSAPGQTLGNEYGKPLAFFTCVQHLTTLGSAVPVIWLEPELRFEPRSSDSCHTAVRQVTTRPLLNVMYCSPRRSSEGYDDDRYRELIPAAVARVAPARRTPLRRRMLCCFGKQENEETPVLNRMPAHRNISQVWAVEFYMGGG